MMPAEVKATLKFCTSTYDNRDCDECPYGQKFYAPKCVDELMKDAAFLIDSLETVVKRFLAGGDAK